MDLVLSQLPETLVHYTGQPVPRWMRALAPDAAASILAIQEETGGLSFTDVWRSAEISLLARKKKSGVQRPGYSAHNFGLAFDMDVEGTKKKLGWAYPEIRKYMESKHWYCHRMDLKEGKSEYWHFNWLGPNPDQYLKLRDPKRASTWSEPVEARIFERYGTAFNLSNEDVQRDLKSLRMYSGEIDGILGPISTQSVTVFQKAWGLAADGVAGPMTRRTLSFVTATKKFVEPQAA